MISTKSVISNLLRAGKLNDAIAYILDKNNKTPDPENMNLLGQLYMRKSLYAEALSAFENAIESCKKVSTFWNDAANAKKKLGDIVGAEHYYLRSIELDAQTPLPRFNIAQIYISKQNYEGAISHLYEALRYSPDHIECSYLLARCYQDNGRFSEAGKLFTHILQLNPLHIGSIIRLVSLPNETLSLALVKRAHLLVRNIKVSLSFRQRLCFALAKYYDSQKNYKEALLIARHGNSLKQASSGFRYSTPKFDFTYKIEAQNKSLRSISKCPVFILGLPRSGTSLVEQILSSHSLVGGAGEPNKLGKLINGYVGATSKSLDHAAVNAIRSQYDADVLQTYKGSVEMLIDKSLDLSDFAHILPSIFPEAVFIACERELKDVALSCFMTGFSFANDFTTRFTDIFKFADYRQNMLKQLHSQDKITHTVKYEAMVEAPEKEITDLLSALSLSFESDCIDFFKNPRPVKTESYWQVRQPIYKSSVGRWKHYAKWVPEFSS